VSRRRFCLSAFALLAVILVTAYAARGVWLPGMLNWLDVGQPPQPADYVVLLGGDDDSRPFSAAALVKAGWAPQVLLAMTETSPLEVAGILPSRPEIARRVLLYSGVPQADIHVLGEGVSHTYGEAQCVARFLQARDRPARLIVVTNGYHTRRARLAVRHAVGTRASLVTCFSAPIEDIKADNWWQTELGFLAVTSEYAKWLFYSFCYGWLGYQIAAALGLLVVILLGWKRRSAKKRLNSCNPRNGACSPTS